MPGHLRDSWGGAQVTGAAKGSKRDSARKSETARRACAPWARGMRYACVPPPSTHLGPLQLACSTARRLVRSARQALLARPPAAPLQLPPPAPEGGAWRHCRHTTPREHTHGQAHGTGRGRRRRARASARPRPACAASAPFRIYALVQNLVSRARTARGGRTHLQPRRWPQERRPARCCCPTSPPAPPPPLLLTTVIGGA